MQLVHLFCQALELAINYTQLFHAKRNRVEIISDFPDGNDAEVLSSLRLHPQGWVALSRNTSSDEGSEWCCVHDIQSLPTQPDEDQAVGERPPLTWRSGGVPRARPSVPVVQVTLDKLFIAILASKYLSLFFYSILATDPCFPDLPSGEHRDHQHGLGSQSSSGKAGDRDRSRGAAEEPGEGRSQQ